MTIPNYGNRLNIFYIQRDEPPQGRVDDLWFDPASGNHYIYDGDDWIYKEGNLPPIPQLISSDQGNLITAGQDGLLYATVGTMDNWISGDVGNRLVMGTDSLFFVPPVDTFKIREELGDQPAAVTWDWNNATGGFEVTLTGDALIGAPSNPPALGAGNYVSFGIRIQQDATGGRVPTWDAIWRNPPVLSDDPDAVDELVCLYDGAVYRFMRGVEAPAVPEVPEVPVVPSRLQEVLGDQAANVDWDWDNGDGGASVTLTGDALVGIPANPPSLAAGEYVELLFTVTQDATGTRVPTWDAIWVNPPVLSTAPDAVDYISCIYDGTSYVFGQMTST